MKMSIVILLALAAFLATASALKCQTCRVPGGPGDDAELEVTVSNCANGKGWKEEECPEAHMPPEGQGPKANASCYYLVVSGNKARGYTKLNHIYDKLVF